MAVILLFTYSKVTILPLRFVLLAFPANLNIYPPICCLDGFGPPSFLCIVS